MSAEADVVVISDRAAHLAQIHLGVTVPLLACCIAVLAIRASTKIRHSNLYIDDAFVATGLILSIVDWALLMKEIIITPHTIPIDSAIEAIKLTFFAMMIWAWSMTFIKVSVSLTLLRLRNLRAWKIFLFSIIGLQVSFAIGNTVFLCRLCQPLDAAWDYRMTTAKCLEPNAIPIVSAVGSSVNIATDVLLSLSPITFLWELKRPLRERILLGFLMGLGLVASVSSVMRTIAVQQFSTPEAQQGDTWAMAMPIATRTAVEQFLAVFAACAAFLKPTLERLFASFGIPATVLYNSKSTHPRSTFRLRDIASGSHRSHGETSETAINPPTTVYERLDGTAGLPRECVPSTTNLVRKSGDAKSWAESEV